MKARQDLRRSMTFAAKLTKPRAAWIMVPAGDPTEQTVNALAQRFQSGDIIIDGGNSYYKDDVRRSQKLKDRGIHYIDVGTSGGVWGLGARLLHDARRAEGSGRTSRSYFSRHLLRVKATFPRRPDVRNSKAQQKKAIFIVVLQAQGTS